MELVDKPPLATVWPLMNFADELDVFWRESGRPASMTFTFARWEGGWIVEVRQVGMHLGWLLRRPS